MDAGVKRDLVRASHSGDWEAAVQIFDRYPDALTSWINEYSETSLHIAANVGHTQFVLNLTRRLASHDIAKTDWSNHVALHGAAAADCTEIARAMMERNETLTGFINYRGETPLIKAFQCAGKEMVDFLYQSDKAKDPCPFERENIGVRTLTNAIYSGYFDEALYLVDNFPHLLVGFDEKDNTALLALAKKPSVFKSSSRLGFLEGIIYSCIHLEQAHDRTPNGTTQNAIGSNTQNPTTGTSAMPNLVRFLQKALINRVAIIKRVYNKKLMHKQSVELVKRICEQLEDISAQIEDGRIENMEAPFYQVRGAMHLAAENGIEELIIECLNHFPGQVWYVLDDQHCRYHKRASYQGTPFHTAIVYRQEKIFNLIHRTGGFKKMLSFYGSNMLHLVAKLAPSSRINCVSGAALQMQRELQWFKEIEKFVSPHCKEETNNEGKTPRAAFGEEHMDLVEKGEKWMKDTATSCMIVATLIATVVFAAAFTVPGGNIDGKGTPIFLEETSFMIFLISDTIALFSSITSVLMFLAILTARYAVDDFLESLPKKLIIGLATLFISIAGMVIAFSSALFIILGDQKKRLITPIILFACLPVTSFGLLEFPLFIEIIFSTYGQGIFHRKCDHLIFRS